MIEFILNGTAQQLDVDPDMPLLWAIRDHAGLTGTKYGCGRALCGACMVHLDGEAVPSCSLPVSAAAGRSVTTIEGLDTPAGKALQAAWVALDVVQCGYCQPGQIMAAAGLLNRNPAPDAAEITSAMSVNICRCGTYRRIHAAIREAARSLTKPEDSA